MIKMLKCEDLLVALCVRARAGVRASERTCMCLFL